jgi:DNA-binding CsgD family transcriptional regulator
VTKANRKNPFGLTYRQCELMEALIELGSPKAIAYQEQSNEKTIRNTLNAAKERIGVSTYVQAAIAYDRKRRASIEAGVKPASVWEYAGGVHGTA